LIRPHRQAKVFVHATSSDDNIRSVMGLQGKVLVDLWSTVRPQDDRSLRTTTREHLWATGCAFHAREDLKSAEADAHAAEEEVVDQETNPDARQGRLGFGPAWSPLKFVVPSNAYRSVTLEYVWSPEQRATSFEARPEQKVACWTIWASGTSTSLSGGRPMPSHGCCATKWSPTFSRSMSAVWSSGGAK